MKIQINEFKGIMPKLANDKLPINMAQTASDLKTATGELVAIKASTADVSLPGTEYKSIFQYLEGSNAHWVYTNDINHFARSPIADDTFERTYYTGTAAIAAVGTITFTDSITDGQTLTIGSDVYEYDIAEDGVAGSNILVGDSTTTTKELAASTLATAVAASGTASISLTDNADGTVTITASTAGNEGNYIIFSETGANISMDGSGYLGGTTLGKQGYRAFANDIISGGGFDFTTDYYNPGSPIGFAPTLAGYTGSGSEVRSYFYSFVSRYGEEGPGSTIAEVTDYASGRMQINDIQYPNGDDHLTEEEDSNYPTVRVYRTDSTASTSDFYEVCEAYWFSTAQSYAVGDFVFYLNDLWECTTIHPAGVWNAGHFTQGEAVAVADLGSIPTSYLWRRAPNGLTNLRSHPNGFYVASKDKTLYFTEAYTPWAWPEDFQIPLPANIIGLGVYGSTIVVATDANIYTFSGPHPTSLYKQKLSYQPCLSQRAVVETDQGVMFPAQEGFQLVDQNGATNVTSDLFSPEDWDDYELETMHAVWYNKSYYGFFSDVEEGNIRIDFLNSSITTGADYHWAGYVAIADGIFRTIFASSIGSSSLYISQWDNDTTRYRNYQYKSPRFILEKPMNFKVAQVILDTDFYNAVLDIIADGSELETLNAAEWATGLIDAPLNGAPVNDQDVNGDGLFNLSSLGVQAYIDFRIYVNSVLKFTKQVSNSQMFKLPRGFKHKKWEIEVVGMIPIKRITMATSVEEIV